MPKIIFTSGISPNYDDIPEVRCEFPKRYLKAVTEAIGDSLIYYEPRKNGGRMSYYAIARVERVERHPTNPDHYYMIVSDYLDFIQPVPYRTGTTFMESALDGKHGKPNLGSLQWSVRRLPEEEFSAILQSGFGNSPLVGIEDDLLLAEEPFTYNRPISQQIINRPFRDKAFSENIHAAYNETCAFTGLSLTNDKGLYEVHAAHIRAVEDNGPDSRRNGLALTQTIHWLFDRGSLSMEDDGKILQVGQLIPDKIKSILNEDGYARFPEEAHLRPHPQFLRFHRENRFVG